MNWLSIKIVLWPFRLYQIMKFVTDKKKSWAWQSQSSRHSSDRPRHSIKISTNTKPCDEPKEYDTILLRRRNVEFRPSNLDARRHFLPMILYVSAKKDNNSCQSARRKTSLTLTYSTNRWKADVEQNLIKLYVRHLGRSWLLHVKSSQVLLPE